MTRLAVLMALGGLLLFALGGLAVAVLTGNGRWLLCRLGLHVWERTVMGTGRDVRHVVRCIHCEKVKVWGGR